MRPHRRRNGDAVGENAGAGVKEINQINKTGGESGIRTHPTKIISM
jgi:hypothetical protein